MELSSENFRRGARLGVPDRPDGRAVVFRTAAVPAGNIQVMGFKAGLLEQQQGAGHQKLDIIRMRCDSDGSFTAHLVTWFNLTGLPVAAARSAAKITSCVSESV